MQTKAWPNMTPFFSKAGLRRFVLTKELFVIRPCFIDHLTAKKCAMFSWLSLQVIFGIWYFKLQLASLIVSELENSINLSIKVHSSLARPITRVPGEWVFLHQI